MDRVVSLFCLLCMSLMLACWGSKPSAYNPFTAGPSAKELMPARLTAGGSFSGEVRTMRVRIYADHEHRAQFRIWKTRFRTQLDLANQILIPELGVRLEVASFETWTRQSSDARIQEMLKELEARDSGADVEWVIGLVSALSSVTTRMHALGASRPLGRHIILRGYNDMAERKVLGEKFDESLAVAYREHKQATLLLHELGHTLGAMHVVGDHNDLMSPAYHKDIQGFSPQNMDVMRTVVEARLLAADQRSRAGEALALQQHLDSVPRWEGWVGTDYEEMRAWLKEMAAMQPAEQDAPQARSGIPSEAKTMFIRIQGLARSGKVDEALGELDGLIQAYPAHVELRLLACQLWLKKEGATQAAMDQCRRVGELDAGNVAGELLLAEVHVRDGRLVDANASLRSAVDRMAAAREQRQESWNTLLSMYQAMRSVTWAEEAMARAPSSVDVSAFRAWALSTRRRYGLPPSGQRHKITPEREAEYLAEVRVVLDLVYAKELDKARKLAQKGLKAFPDAPGLLGALCDLEYRARHFDAARSRCARAIHGYDEASWPRYLMGIIELRSQRNASGIAHLEKAIAMDPDLRQAYHALYQAYQRVKNKDGQQALHESYYNRFQMPIPTK